MANSHIRTSLNINGEFIDQFQQIILEQEFGKHHYFSVILKHDVIEVRGGHTLEKSKSWLCKSVMINFGESEFLGIIEEVSICHEDGLEGDIELKGRSKTVLLEGGLHTQSWTEKNLTTIVKDVCNQAEIDAKVAPQFSDVIPYEVQHLESHFHFLQRLALKYNEWLYYDGTHVCFGKPESTGEKVGLQYGVEATSIRVGIQASAVAHSQYYYDPEQDKQESLTAKNKIKGLNELADDAFQASNALFKIKPHTLSQGFVKDKMLLDDSVGHAQARGAAKMNVLEVGTRQQGITLGTPLEMTAISKGKEQEKRHYGDYLVSRISHAAEGTGEYKNQIEALPGNLEVLPEIKGVQAPIVHSQLALVSSHADPKGMGRVKVKFHWMQAMMESNWVRVMMPDAGSSDKVSKNRGHVFIPEVGDQVMVGFEEGDPSRPFVMGGLYHGKTGAGGDENNKVKSITTRSGSTITFDDDQNEGTITVSDPSGATIVLNGDGTMNISTPKSITMTSKELHIIGEDKVNIESKEVNITGTDSIKGVSGKLVEIQSKKTSLHAEATEIISQKTTDVEGTMQTNIVGGVVNLN